MRRPRIPTTAATAVLLASVTTGIAGAQTSSTDVSSDYGARGSHVLEVNDLRGGDLTDLALVPGERRTLRVGVRSAPPAELDPTGELHGYTVETSMTNLYALDGAGAYDFAAESIPSSEVSLDYATSALDVRETLGRMDPEYLLSTAQPITCDAIANALGLLDATTLLDTTTCLLLSTIDGGLTFADLHLEGNVLDQVDLASLLPSQLPLIPQAGVEAGVFTLPDCIHGAGASDPSCGSDNAGTEQTVLSAAPTTAVAAELAATVTDQAPTTLATMDTTPAKATLTQVIEAMQLSGITDVADFANSMIQDFTEAEQLQIVNDLLAAGDPILDAVDDLVGYGGLGNAFPSLEVNPASAPAGSYAGTFTVRLIECPACS